MRFIFVNENKFREKNKLLPKSDMSVIRFDENVAPGKVYPCEPCTAVKLIAAKIQAYSIINSAQRVNNV